VGRGTRATIYYRKCEDCGLRIRELTLKELAEDVGRGTVYKRDMDVSCPNCTSTLVQKYTKLPDSADTFEPTGRDLGKDTLREVREKMFARKRTA
jgi:hypothetical protein